MVTAFLYKQPTNEQICRTVKLYYECGRDEIGPISSTYECWGHNNFFLAAKLQELTSKRRLAFGSFVDKVVPPFVKLEL